MVESTKKAKEFCSLDQRKSALEGELPKKDYLIDFMCQNAETLFQPKTIKKSDDWLACHEEKGQTFQGFKDSKTRNKTSKERNTIYLYIVDEMIDDDFKQMLLAYCKAFYHGMQVNLMEPKIQGDFMGRHQIPSRINQYTGMIQYDAGAILTKTIPMIPKSAYCMLTVTLQDLYPRPSWNFVFGLANLQERTGVFSFVRYDPLFQGIETPDRDKILKRNACGVMVHEIGHMFGIKHCTYYECTMNGSNSYEESTRAIRFLCPVCTKKLKLAIGFDTKERLVKLKEACEIIGFSENVEFYNNLLLQFESKQV
ncbi:hypothetical protein FGO68_gene6121 [Halteria grandinella]|uniref:Archaemetzincin-2 n=1 Tax=Halteria grandinella TaxID=5974 RepID=A0A8J8NL61_HALGN|nr:hypothetical protein FGO68_gene6121 [Halteria grandinella]